MKMREITNLVRHKILTQIAHHAKASGGGKLGTAVLDVIVFPLQNCRGYMQLFASVMNPVCV